ncbi:MAG: rRNA pseudouridine synthase [Ignavibacteria bacterium]|nr:rRNA pseudouridine synthase [Ignavibacteria bacterium]
MKNLDKIVSLPRALSKLGICSRSQAEKLIFEGRVKVNSKICRNHKLRVNLYKDKIEVDGKLVEPKQFIYIALNKPRGLVTTTKDEKNRETVYKCFEGFDLPYIFPVGRLDKASEGLLLFTNDTEWANQILNPQAHIEKTYHVKINRKIEHDLIEKILSGIETKEGEILKVKSIKILREGTKTCWLEIVLDEGKNRQIRRIFETLEIEVLRLVRVAVGNLKLGNLKKGEFKILSEQEIESVLTSYNNFSSDNFK